MYGRGTLPFWIPTDTERNPHLSSGHIGNEIFFGKKRGRGGTIGGGNVRPNDKGHGYTSERLTPLEGEEGGGIGRCS